MKKDSVLNLKKNLLRTLARRGFQRPNQLEGLASPNIEERLAVGYSHLGKGSYRLELRVQRGSGAAYRLAEEFKKKAKQEANIEEVPRIEIPLDPDDVDLGGLKSLSQHKRPLHIGLSISHSDGPAGTLGAFATDDHGSLGILSNNHVLALMGTARLRDRVTQPGLSNLAENEIGSLSNYIIVSKRRRDSSDAAFAILDKNIPHDLNRIPSGLGFPFGGTTIKEIQPAEELLALLRANTPVCKIGSTTPFHVIDDDIVILSLDHPFIPEGRFASLLVRDKELSQRLADGFENLWTKAMRDLREIDFHPGGSARQS